MDFHELEAYISLAETLHFAHAASRVHLSPSALSRLVARLEEELGATLLDRDTRRVSLTPEGEVFLEFARKSVHEKRDMALRLSRSDGGLTGILRIYASVTACYSILPPLVEALTREHPALRLSVDTGDPAGAAEAVREERVELGLAALPQGGYPDLVCHSVQKTPLVFVASQTGPYGNLDVSGDGGALGELIARVPVILPKSGLARERFDRWIRSRGFRPLVAAETAGNEAILALARLGLGLGLVPRLVLENGPFAAGLVQYGAGADFGEYDIGFVQKAEAENARGKKRLREELSRIILKTYPG